MMDSFSFNNLEAEKANAVLKQRKLRRVASLLRIVEVCAVLVLVSRLSMHLPVAVRSSGEYLRDLSLFMHSPRFVFLVGNVIVITLFAQFSASNAGEQNLYQEFVHNSAEAVAAAECGRKNKQRMKTGEKKVYRRCESEREAAGEKRRRVLRRCQTERVAGGGEEAVKASCPEDGMSNEEFRRTVEAFIARQQRIRREEEGYNYYLM